jgi:hypothetical protein
MFQDVLVIVGCCWMLLDAVGVEIQASAGRPEKVDVAVFVFQLQSPDPRQLTSLRYVAALMWKCRLMLRTQMISGL